jgi:hypothetical protein
METANPVSRPPSSGPTHSGAGDRLPTPIFPPQPTRLIDCEEDLTRLGDLLSHAETRPLTLTGPGVVSQGQEADVIGCEERADEGKLVLTAEPAARLRRQVTASGATPQMDRLCPCAIVSTHVHSHQTGCAVG